MSNDGPPPARRGAARVGLDPRIATRRDDSGYLESFERVGVLAGEKRGRDVIIYRHPALLEVLTA
jgi:hypothetical protein